MKISKEKLSAFLFLAMRFVLCGSPTLFAQKTERVNDASYVSPTWVGTTVIPFVEQDVDVLQSRYQEYLALKYLGNRVRDLSLQFYDEAKSEKDLELRGGVFFMATGGIWTYLFAREYRDVKIGHNCRRSLYKSLLLLGSTGLVGVGGYLVGLSLKEGEQSQVENYGEKLLAEIRNQELVQELLFLEFGHSKKMSPSRIEVENHALGLLRDLEPWHAAYKQDWDAHHASLNEEKGRLAGGIDRFNRNVRILKETLNEKLQTLESDFPLNSTSTQKLKKFLSQEQRLLRPGSLQRK